LLAFGHKYSKPKRNPFGLFQDLDNPTIFDSLSLKLKQNSFFTGRITRIYEKCERDKGTKIIFGQISENKFKPIK
jgi:hypothetical protein